MVLMDGSFDDKNIQAGANVGQTIAVDLASTETDEVGNFVIRGESKVTAPAAAQAVNSIAGGDTVIAGFAGTATITSAAADTQKNLQKT